MKLTILKKTGALLALFILLALGSARAQDTIYGFGGSGFNPTSFSLFSFSSSSPGSLSSMTAITGIAGGFTLESIDFRASNGLLYGLAYNGTNTAQLYTLNINTGVASVSGGQFSIGSAQGGSGLSIGIDFDPNTNLLRVLTGTNGNFRVNADTGVIVGGDSGLAYAAGDPNASAGYQIANGGHTNAGSLFDIDYNNNDLVQQNPKNDGTLHTVGSLGITLVNGTRSIGFDISDSGTAYLSGNRSSDGGQVRERLFTVNLTTGHATSLGLIGGDPNFNVIDIAVVPEPSTWVALFGGGALLLVVRLRGRRQA